MVKNRMVNAILYKNVDSTTRRLLLTNICRCVKIRTVIQLNNVLPPRRWNCRGRDDRFRRSIVMDTLQQHDPNSKPNLKKCSKCPNSYPATTEFFYKTKTGLEKQCKQCKLSRQKERHVENKEHIAERSKKYAEKNKDKISEYQKQHYEKNKESIQARHKKYREDNQDAIKEYNKKYVSEHKEERAEYNRTHMQEYHKAYRIEHKEEAIQYMQEYRIEHAEEIKQKQKEYYQTENGRIAARAHKNKRKAQKKAVEGTLTKDQIQQKLKAQKYRCYYSACGHAKFEKKNGHYIFHLEHTVPLSRTEEGPRHDPNFVVLACPTCNMSKNDKCPWEWYQGGRLF
jgi:hypothetical protein